MTGPMKIHDSLRQAKNFVQANRGELAPQAMSEEELNPGPQDDLSVQAEPLESMSGCYQVDYSFPEDSGASEFSFFEDGRQKTIPIGYVRSSVGSRELYVPVHYFVVASVILRRDGRCLHVWSVPRMRSGIMINKSLLNDLDICREFEDKGLYVADTQVVDGDYYSMRRAALTLAKRLRLEVENELIDAWQTSHDSGEGFLVVDGTLMNLRNERNVERCIGVSKSFGSRYFDVLDHNRILQMPQFYRSWTFRFHAQDEDDDPRMGGRDRVSWYLRLRELPQKDPEFGLIRVEISTHHSNRASELADRFSRSLISERLPTAYPAPRWDNHLYPVQACENYLSSIMPSTDTIAAAMRG